jgi:hypothetical protein
MPNSTGEKLIGQVRLRKIHLNIQLFGQLHVRGGLSYSLLFPATRRKFGQNLLE